MAQTTYVVNGYPWNNWDGGGDSVAQGVYHTRDSSRYQSSLTFKGQGNYPNINLNTTRIVSAALTLRCSVSGGSNTKNLFIRQGSTSGPLLYQNRSTSQFFTFNRNSTFTIYLDVNDSSTQQAIADGVFYFYSSNSEDPYSSSRDYSTHYAKLYDGKITLVTEPLSATITTPANGATINVNQGQDSAINVAYGNIVSSYYYRLQINYGQTAIVSYKFTGSNYSSSLGFPSSYVTSLINAGAFNTSTTAQMTFNLYTYSDANRTIQIGTTSTNTVYFRLASYTSASLSISSIEYTNNSPYSAIDTFAVANNSTVRLNFSYTPPGGANRSSVTIGSWGGMTGTLSSTATNYVIINVGANNDGDFSVSLRVTDSRGGATSASVTISVRNYYSPRNLRFTAERTVNNNKDTFTVYYQFQAFTGATINSISLKVYPSGSSSAYLTLSLYPQATIYEYTGTSTITDQEYRLVITATDSYGVTSDEFETILPSMSYLMHFRTGGRALSIGGAAPSTDDTVRIYWNLQLDQPLDIAYGGTGASTAALARTNLGITPANIGAATSTHTHPNATYTTSGFMSGAEKTKLSSIFTEIIGATLTPQRTSISTGDNYIGTTEIPQPGYYFIYYKIFSWTSVNINSKLEFSSYPSSGWDDFWRSTNPTNGMYQIEHFDIVPLSKNDTVRLHLYSSGNVSSLAYRYAIIKLKDL